MKAPALASALAIATTAVAGRAHALDLPPLAGQAPQLQVTETDILAQRFAAREGEKPTDQGFGQWLNRLDLALTWGRWTAGTRIDSAVYWNRAEDEAICPSGSILPCLPAQYGTPGQQANIRVDGASRFRDSIYPAKLWVSYAAPGLEITAGDAYVQFGRGLVLSLRKIDELGIDTTLRGGKIQWQSDMFGATLVAGFANPSRVDEASGRALFLPQPIPGFPQQPLFGSDRIVGAEIQAGRGLPVTLSTHAVNLTRCSPTHFDARGNAEDDGTLTLGSCDPNDKAIWLATVGNGGGPVINADQVDMVGQAIEIPSLWHHGKIYVEGAIQRRTHTSTPADPNPSGNAIYAAVSGDVDRISGTLEIKSYRNFYPLAAAVDITHAPEFANVAYSNPPTTELLTQDSEFGFFNACVDGGRARVDLRASPELLVYGTAAYYHSKSEITTGSCDGSGRVIAVGVPAASVETYVWDGVSGIEWTFDRARSHVYASTGVRNDIRGTGAPYYRELHVEYDVVQSIRGPWSIEVTGRHRLRYEDSQNAIGPRELSEPWHEGENYAALKIAPRWVLSQGFEYTTLVGLPTYYFNGSVRYNFTSDSNVVVFVGEQREGLRCVAGICRVFPAFEGARAELTARF